MAASDLAEFRRVLGSSGYDPASLTSVSQALDRFKEPLALVTKICNDRKQRLAEEARRKEKNRINRENLAKAQAAQEEQDQEQEHEMEDAADAAAAAGAPMAVDDEEPEPATTEALCLAPRQPASAASAAAAVDLSPLQLHLDAPGDPGAQQELLAALLASQQLFAYVGAFDAESASPVLRVLFQLVVRGEGDGPPAALRQALQYYATTEPEDMGWVPQLSDFWSALHGDLGYQAPRGSQGGGAASRKRGSGERERESGGPGEGPGGAAGGSGGGGPWVVNLGCLLRLLTELLVLQQQGKVDLGCNSQAEGTGKQLLTAMLRMLLDGELAACLQPGLGAAVEALMGAWDEVVWRRLGDFTADLAAGLGPSHRAAYRLIAAVQGLGDRVRGWQQAAALQLLRRELPKGYAAGGAGGSGGGGHRRGQAGPEALGAELRSLLGARASPSGARALREALRRRGGDGGVDMWRAMTILECVHIVARHAVFDTEREGTEGGEGCEGAELARWLGSHLNQLEQVFRSSSDSLAMRVKVLLAEMTTFYAGFLVGEH